MNTPLKWWKRHFLGAEFCLSVVLAVCFVLWYVLFEGESFLACFLHGNRAAIYGTAASIFGSLLGFVITATSIVLGFSTSERLNVVRESKQFGTLWRVFSNTIWALGLATASTFIALIFDRDTHPIPALLFLSFFAIVLSFFRLSRAVWVLENVIALITMPSKKSTPGEPS